MKRSYKIALILGLAVMIPSVTVYAATVFTLTTPASVTVVLAPGLSMYPYTGTFPSGTCGTSAVSSVGFSSVAQGASETIYVCLDDTGGTNFYITSSSFSTDLSSAVGTLGATYYLTGGSSPQSPPIFFTPNSEVIVAFALTIVPGATVATDNFNINVAVFSTNTG